MILREYIAEGEERLAMLQRSEREHVIARWTRVTPTPATLPTFLTKLAGPPRTEHAIKVLRARESRAHEKWMISFQPNGIVVDKFSWTTIIQNRARATWPANTVTTMMMLANGVRLASAEVLITVNKNTQQISAFCRRHDIPPSRHFAEKSTFALNLRPSPTFH